VRREPSSNRRRAPVSRSIRILFEDDEILVVDKPAGLLTISTNKEKNRTLYAHLFDHVKSKRPPEKLFIVHRLDREASGLLVFAKSETAKRRLQDQFKGHSTHRIYRAVTERRMPHDRYTIDSYLAENRIHRSYSTRDPSQGQRAVTHVRVLRRTRHRTLVEVELETGRKHQIRAHLAEQGHPIVGDHAYGSLYNPIRRLALHAVKLAFKHPQTDRLLVFASAAPKQFDDLV